MITWKFHLLISILAAGLALLAAPAFSAEFIIKDYRVSVQVRADSLLEFEENLTVVFHWPCHWVIRKIPVSHERGKKSSEEPRRFSLARESYTIDVMDVSTPGRAGKVYRSGNDLFIRMGDADRYMSGEQRYVIRYTVSGAVNFFADRSELYWNLIANEWGALIEKASFSVRFPRPLALQVEDLFVHAGAAGQQQENISLRVGKQAITGKTADSLQPGQGLTVRVRFPPGYLEEGGLWFKTRLIFINSPVLWVPIILFLVLLPLWWFMGRDKKPLIVPLYNPPKDMTPPEMAFLINEGGQPQDLVSLLPYWGAQGALTIEVLEGVDNGRDDYLFTKLAEPGPGARKYEKIIFDRLFRLRGNRVLMSERRDRFGSTMQMGAAMLEEHVVAQGWFRSGSRLLGNYMMGLGIAGLVVGVLWALIALFGLGFLDIPKRIYYVPVTPQEESVLFSWANTIAISTSGVLLFLFGWIMPQKATMGDKLHAEVMGFKEFLERAEREKLKTLLEQDPDYFDHTLAFAMALGLADQWSEKFQGLVIQTPPWYQRPEPMSMRWVLSEITTGLRQMAAVIFGSSPV